MKRNVELLERTMQFLIDHPELHKQEEWTVGTECGTAGCFFGWACMLSGLEPIKNLRVGHASTYVFRDDGIEVGAREYINVRNEAERLLGLTREESYDLSRGTNSREMLQLMVKDLVNGDELRDWGEYWIRAGGHR